MNNLTLPVEQMATLLALTPRRIQQLAVEGTILRDDQTGQYLLHPSVGRYCAALANQRDPAQQKLTVIRSRTAELDLAKREGRLIPVEEAEATIQETLGIVLSALNSLPARIAGHRNLKERRRIEDVIDAMRIECVQKITKLRAETGAPATEGEPT